MQNAITPTTELLCPRKDNTHQQAPFTGTNMNIKIDINNCRVCLQSGKGQPLFGAATRYDQKYTLITQLPVS